VNWTLTHAGDAGIARHVGNCVVRIDSRGTRLAKEHRHSTRLIDLAVAMVMAHARATTMATTRVLQVF
jgi:phage terminase large subunit-like protein